MKTLSRILLCLVYTTVFVVSAWAQAYPPPSQTDSTSLLTLPIYTLNAVPVRGVNKQVIGGPGQATYCYWTVANYPVGSAIKAAGCVTNGPNTLTSGNYILLSPIMYPPGATVDILQTTTEQIAPTGACNCAVATGLTSGQVSQTSNTLSSYTVPTFNPTVYALTLTNEVVGSGTHLILRQGWPWPGTEVVDLSTAGGTTLPCTTTSTSMTCSVAQTAPTGASSLELVGGPSPGIGFILSDASLRSIYDWQAATGINQKGINITVGTDNASGFAVFGQGRLVLFENDETIFGPEPITFNTAGAASQASLMYEGSLFTGGSGTTTYPLFFFNQTTLITGTFPTTWSTAGTVIGMNEAIGFAGNFLDLYTNGTREFNVTGGGIANATGGFQQNGTPLGISCGATSTCAATAAPLVHVVYGSVPLVSGSPSTATVTGISPAFTSTTSYACGLTEGTTAANGVKIANTSTSSITITGPNTVTDTIYYVCVGT